MTTSSLTAPPSTCPAWCTGDRVRSDSRAEVGASDPYTWHHTAQPFETCADTTLELSMDWHAYDAPAPDDIPAYVEIGGDDGSGSEVHLQVRTPDLRNFAAQLIAMADAVEATR